MALRAYPQNYTEIWLHFGDIPGANSPMATVQLPEMSVIGPNAAPREYSFHGEFNSLHIAFRLGGEKPFLGYSPSEFDDAPIPIDDLLPGNRVQQLWDMTPYGPLAQVCALERFLAARFQPEQDIEARTRYGIDIIRQSWGRVNVAQLAETLNLSERQLLRSFKLETGLTPKKIMRLVRFNGALLHVNQSQVPNFTHIAMEHGYTDQSHFIREFTHFAGITPTAFLKRRDTLGFLHDEWEHYR